MKINKILIVLILTLILGACAKEIPCRNSVAVNDSTLIGNKMPLAEFLYKSGNIITKREFPYLVHANDVFYNNNEFLLIDIRDSNLYKTGHIDGAYNVNTKDLMSFLKDSVNPVSFSKIIIIDSYGPQSEYIATLLRFDGYNAYGLKFGMGTWNRKFVGNIQKYLSNNYANKINTEPVATPPKGKIPVLESNNILDLLDKRVNKLVAEDPKNFIISPEEVFANPDKYFILAYWTEGKYKLGHIAGSIRYNIRSDLSYNKLLSTLPTDKKIVVYCNTGHHAIAIVAYLRLLGYDASSFMYGINSIMNKRFATLAPGAAILDAKLLTADYPLLEGNQRTTKKTESTVVQNTPPPPPTVFVPKKKTGSVGGCE